MNLLMMVSKKLICNNAYAVWFSLFFLSCLGSTSVWSGDYEVGQTNKKFTISSLTVKVGDTVSFKNNDSFFHNIFSLSDAALFDLGSFPQGESRDVVMDTAGVVEVECAIHPSMQMRITVE